MGGSVQILSNPVKNIKEFLPNSLFFNLFFYYSYCLISKTKADQFSTLFCVHVYQNYYEFKAFSTYAQGVLQN